MWKNELVICLYCKMFHCEVSDHPVVCGMKQSTPAINSPVHIQPQKVILNKQNGISYSTVIINARPSKMLRSRSKFSYASLVVKVELIV
jgi:hypothetical protein